MGVAILAVLIWLAMGKVVLPRLRSNLTALPPEKAPSPASRLAVAGLVRDIAAAATFAGGSLFAGVVGLRALASSLPKSEAGVRQLVE